MTPLQDPIAQFRKMAQDDPTNDLGHYRLGQALMDAGQYDEAVSSFRRALELNPQFAKVYQFMGTCLIRTKQNDEAIKALREGYAVAEEWGHNIPRDEIAKLLAELGQEPPVSKKAPAQARAPGDGFRCQRPGCIAGAHARQLRRPPMNDEIGRKIYEQVCADCWDYWLRNLSIKVINEMRLDLSSEADVERYDNIMLETLGVA